MKVKELITALQALSPEQQEKDVVCPDPCWGGWVLVDTIREDGNDLDTGTWIALDGSKNA